MTRIQCTRLGAAALFATAMACSREPSRTADSAGGAISPSADIGAGSGMLVANNERVGKYMVDVNGRALYVFTKDLKDNSTCVAACAEEWPPYTDLQATSASESSFDRTKLGVVHRTDGKSQVSYYGMPLHLYRDDKDAGDMKGAGKKDSGGEWYLVSPEGRKVDAKGIASEERR